MNYTFLDSSENASLLKYLDNLQSRGRYFFPKKDALNDLGCSEENLDRSIRRLERKKRVANIKPGFITITPLEYKSWGVIPTEWFIHPLMEYLGCSYYVGLLSAAALYGAAHQQPQQFQVITDKVIRKITKGKANVWFFQKNHVKDTPINEIQTHTGQMKVSTPEATALDLVKFYKRAGYLSNVATVLAELIEVINGDLLAKAAHIAKYERPVIQRLGFLLSLKEVGGSEIARPLYELIKKFHLRYIPLAIHRDHKNCERDDKWKVIINEAIEVDL